MKVQMKFIQTNLVDRKGRICADSYEIKDLGEGPQEYWLIWNGSGDELSDLRATKFVPREGSEAQMRALGIRPQEFIDYGKARTIRDVLMLGTVVFRHHRRLIQVGGLLKWSADCFRKIGLLILKITIRIVRMVPAVCFVLLVRGVRPWLLVRWGPLYAQVFGHFLTSTDTYVCEKKRGIGVPDERFVDLFWLPDDVSNRYLARMWGRVLCIWPRWFMKDVNQINRWFPGSGHMHFRDVPGPSPTGGRPYIESDLYRVTDDSPPVLSFTGDEVQEGKRKLIEMGLTLNRPYVCLYVRDGAYDASKPEREDHAKWTDYRNGNVQDFIPMCEALIDEGIQIVRMGSKVWEPIKYCHPSLVDYAVSGYRTEFMDLFLAANSYFGVSTDTGSDEMQSVFRKEMVYVDFADIAWFRSNTDRSLTIFQHRYSMKEKRILTFKEIIARNLLRKDNENKDVYEGEDICLTSSSPDDICEVVLEKLSRLRNTWRGTQEDEARQERFRTLFPTDILDLLNNQRAHSDIRARIGAQFLRKYPNWI